MFSLSKFFFTLCTLIISFQIQASENLKKNLATLSVQKPLINETIEITPMAEHHFNLEAPQVCGEDATPDFSARKLKCQYHSPGSRKITASVCDDKKTYCKQEYFEISVLDKKSGTPRMAAPISASTLESQKALKKILMSTFQVLTPEQAQVKASDKKAILLVVSTDWCPPCNALKEFLFATKEFQKLTEDLLLVYVDGDSQMPQQWKAYVQTYFYPSLVFLNKDLKMISLNTGHLMLYEFKEWKASSIDLLNDPIKAADDRVIDRRAGSYLRMFLDLFNTQEQIDGDILRLKDFYIHNAKYSEAVSLLEATDSKKFAKEILYAKFMDLKFNPDSSKSDDENKQINQKLAVQLLELSPKNFESEYVWAFTENCTASVVGESSQIKKSQTEKTKTAEIKITLSKEKCTEFYDKAMVAIDENQKELFNKQTNSENLVLKIESLSLKADLMMVMGKVQDKKALISECVKQTDDLLNFTPLKEKSRTVRMKKLTCMGKDDSLSSLNEKLLLSLVSDYPFEETFHRKLAKNYLDKKQFQKASVSNELALKYSYGKMWVYNVIAKAKILKAMNKNNLALETIEAALKDVDVDKDTTGRKLSWLDSLRAEQKSLQKN